MGRVTVMVSGTSNQALSAVYGEGLQSVLILSDDSEGAGVAFGGGGHLEGLAIVGIIQSKGGRSGAVDGSALQAFDVDNSVQIILNAILFPLGRSRRIRGAVTGMTGQGQVHNLVLIVHLVHFGNASALGDFHIGVQASYCLSLELMLSPLVSTTASLKVAVSPFTVK